LLSFSETTEELIQSLYAAEINFSFHIYRKKIQIICKAWNCYVYVCVCSKH